MVQEINNLRVGFLQLLCLDNLYKKDKGDVDGFRNKLESFEKKKRFQIVIGILFESCFLRILLSRVCHFRILLHYESKASLSHMS